MPKEKFYPMYSYLGDTSLVTETCPRRSRRREKGEHQRWERDERALAFTQNTAGGLGYGGGTAAGAGDASRIGLANRATSNRTDKGALLRASRVSCFYVLPNSRAQHASWSPES